MSVYILVVFILTFDVVDLSVNILVVFILTCDVVDLCMLIF